MTDVVMAEVQHQPSFLHFGKPQNCRNILREKLLADVVFV